MGGGGRLVWKSSVKIAVKEKTNVQRTVQKQGIAEFMNLVFKACNELNL